MELLGVLIVAPLWGVLSPRLFLRGWLAFLGIIATIVFLFRAGKQYRAFFLLFGSHLTDMLFTFALLLAGFYLLYFYLPFGVSDAEVLIFWLFSTVQLAFILPTVSMQIDQMLAQAEAISPAGKRS